MDMEKLTKSPAVAIKARLKVERNRASLNVARKPVREPGKVGAIVAE
jgi:hypothetical protein